MEQGCISCRTLAGHVRPPGGVLASDPHWALFLAERPLLVAGQGFIVLRRHCEDVAALTEEEAAALGPMLRRAAAAYSAALGPERIHFGLYCEGVRHIHLHVTPRVRGLPAGNIPLTLLHQWYALLARAGLRRHIPEAAVLEAAGRLRAALGEAA